MELRCIFLELGLFLGAANFTSNKPTIIAGDSIKAKAPTMNPSKSILWLSKKLSAEIKVTALIEPYAAAIAAELKTSNLYLKIKNPISGIINDIIIAAPNVGKTWSVKPLFCISIPPLKPIAKSKYKEKSLGRGAGISRSDLKNIEIAPIKKNSTGGANTFCNMGFISINY